LRTSDLAKPDLVQRDDNVTLIYESAGLYLTIRGKAMESGTDGDVVNVLNLQSKRTVSGVVIGRDQVAITVATPRLPAAADASSTLGSAEPAAPVAVASGNSSQVSPKAE
jgi:flagella basal body P-ring formation protein FlgA